MSLSQWFPEVKSLNALSHVFPATLRPMRIPSLASAEELSKLEPSNMLDTPKCDGVHGRLSISPHGVYIQDRAKKVYAVAPDYRSQQIMTQAIILEVEVVQPTGSNDAIILALIFDVCLPESVEQQSAAWIKNWQTVCDKTWQFGKLLIMAKPVERLNPRSKFITGDDKERQFLLQGKYRVPYDGAILIDAHTGNCFKRKFEDTLDVYHAGEHQLYYYREDNRTREFLPPSECTLIPALQPAENKGTGPVIYPIVEVMWSAKERSWKIYRPRPEKPYGNAYDTIVKTIPEAKGLKKVSCDDLEAWLQGKKSFI